MRRSGLCGLVFFALGMAASAAGPAFDAASVKITGPEVKQPYIIAGGPGTSDPGRFSAPRVDMSYLLGRAFGASMDQLVAPAWIRDPESGRNYSVTATMAPDTTKEQFELMLQNLLVERFHLVFHHEIRSFPGYELVVDKGGPKFKEVTTTPGDNRDFGTMLFGGMGNARGGADGFPVFPSGSRLIGVGTPGGQRMKYQERTMAQFISILGNLILSSQGKSVREGYPQPRVVDRTGLDGRYTFILEFQSAANLRSPLPSQAGLDTGNGSPPLSNEPEGGFPNIFTAIQEQLGLRLIRTADVPADLIVVESVDKVPTEN